jgi:ParB family chromosome partitioning protein
MGKKVLGRGLKALLPEEELTESIHMIDISQIKPNPFQPRLDIDSETIRNLADSIREKGLLQPIILRKRSEHYEIVAGERRFLAAKEAGLKKIPAKILDVNDREMLEIALIENIEREDLNPIEEAVAYKKLMDNFGASLTDISKLVGKDVSTISNTIRLLQLPTDIQSLVREGKITEGHARVLLRVEGNLQRILAEAVMEKGLSVRELEKILQSRSKFRRKKEEDPLSDTLSYYLQRRVTLERKRGGKGWLKIEFRSEEDLLDILSRLSGFKITELKKLLKNRGGK